MPPRIHYSTFVIITIIAMMSGKKRALQKGRTFRNDDISKTYLNFNSNVDRQVHDNNSHVVKQFSTDKMLLESLQKGNT